MENIENYRQRFFNLMESTMGDVKPLINEQEYNDALRKQTTEDIRKIVGAGYGFDYVKLCNYCKTEAVSENNPRAKKAALEFQKAITGVESPLANFGGYEDEDSSAKTAGRALTNNLKYVEDICAMIKYYDRYTGSGESFEEAVSGELSFKADSSQNLELMLGKPINQILLNQ